MQKIAIAMWTASTACQWQQKSYRYSRSRTNCSSRKWAGSHSSRWCSRNSPSGMSSTSRDALAPLRGPGGARGLASVRMGPSHRGRSGAGCVRSRPVVVIRSSDGLHRASALGAFQRIHFEDALQQHGPSGKGAGAWTGRRGQASFLADIDGEGVRHFFPGCLCFQRIALSGKKVSDPSRAGSRGRLVEGHPFGLPAER
jgi:hypothetical protein